MQREATGLVSGKEMEELQRENCIRDDGRLPVWAAVWISSVNLRLETQYLLVIWSV